MLLGHGHSAVYVVHAACIQMWAELKRGLQSFRHGAPFD